MMITWRFGFNRGGVVDVEVTVDGDELGVLHTNGAVREVCLNKVRTFVEKRENLLQDGGMLLSERSRLGTFLWGGVWIPRELPEYEMIKNLVTLRRMTPGSES
jgi:hypothetical protein